MIDFAAIALIVSLAYKQLSRDNLLETRPTQSRVRDTVLFDFRRLPTNLKSIKLESAESGTVLRKERQRQ
jgi:hypothetical protein